MNENLLNALMELIALFARVNKTRFIDNAHALLKTYLEQTLSRNTDNNLLDKFNHYLDYYAASQPQPSTDDSSVKNYITEITKKINSELNEEERIILFLSFLELIKLDAKIESGELSFVEMLYSGLNISTLDYQNSLLFILTDNVDVDVEFNTSFLLITGNKNKGLDELEGTWIEKNRPAEADKKVYVISKDIEGDILVLHFEGINMLAGRYFGSQTCFLNHRKIYPGKFFIISQFDILKVGTDSTFSYHQIVAGFRHNNPHAALRLVGENVSTLGKGQRISIAPFSFSEEPGNLVVVLCNDAAESNNIVHLLTGQLPLTTGKIFLNGYNILSERYRVHKMIGLVPNEPLFDENISIYNNFRFSARLAFPAYPDARIAYLVHQTISTLGLQEVSLLPIKKIPRTLSPEFLKILINTGIEIIRDPFVLVLELPIEKLNAANSEEFCQILKNESNKGRLIFLTSINPGNCVLKKTDRLWIFDTGGYMIYRGLANNALRYFKNAVHNVTSGEDLCPICGNINADHLYQIFNAKVIDKQGKPTHERKLTPPGWYKIYKSEIEEKEERNESTKIIPSYASFIPNVNIQFLSYLRKSVLSFLSNPLKHVIIFITGLVLSFFIASILRYDWTDKFDFSKHESLPLLFFLNTIVCFITGAVWGLQTSYEEKKRIAHDHFNNYSFFSYLNVKYILLLVFVLLFSFIYTFISNHITGIEGLFLPHWLIYLSVAFTGGSIGLFLGNINLRLRSSLVALMLFLAFNVIFSGYMVPFNNLPRQIASEKYVPAFAEIFPGRWAYEALVVEQAINNNFEKKIYKAEQKLSDITFKSNVLIPQLQEKLFNIQAKPHDSLNLSIFYNELNEITKEYPDIYQFEFLDELNKTQVDPEILTELEDYLRYIQFQLYEKYKECVWERNEIRKSLKDSIGNRYEEFLSRNYNQQIAQYAGGRKSGKNYIDTGNEIIQVDDPIFRLPDNNFGRAHFLAPQKLMNGYYYDTSYFNLFMLWLEIFLLYMSTLILRAKSIF